MIAAGPEAARKLPLDSPPPMPSRTATRERSMLDAGQAPVSGPEAANPQIQALQAAQSIEQGFQQLVQLIPATAQFGAAVISALRTQVADALAGSAAGPPGGAAPPPPPMGGM